MWIDIECFGERALHITLLLPKCHVTVYYTLHIFAYEILNAESQGLLVLSEHVLASTVRGGPISP